MKLEFENSIGRWLLVQFLDLSIVNNYLTSVPQCPHLLREDIISCLMESCKDYELIYVKLTTLSKYYLLLFTEHLCAK